MGYVMQSWNVQSSFLGAGAGGGLDAGVRDVGSEIRSKNGGVSVEKVEWGGGAAGGGL